MQTMKELKAAQFAAEQHAGRMYNVRNATSTYAEDMKKKGIQVETMFRNEHDRALPYEQWRVSVNGEVFTMEEFNAMLLILGYIK